MENLDTKVSGYPKRIYKFEIKSFLLNKQKKQEHLLKKIDGINVHEISGRYIFSLLSHHYFHIIRFNILPISRVVKRNYIFTFYMSRIFIIPDINLIIAINRVLRNVKSHPAGLLFFVNE